MSLFLVQDPHHKPTPGSLLKDALLTSMSELLEGISPHQSLGPSGPRYLQERPGGMRHWAGGGVAGGGLVKSPAAAGTERHHRQGLG